jgi:hypothetical protein
VTGFSLVVLCLQFMYPQFDDVDVDIAGRASAAGALSS